MQRTLKKGDLFFKANEYIKCLPEHMMRNRHPMKNLADCFRLARQDTLETPKWAPSPGLSMSWTSFASSPEASNQNLPVQPGTVWYPEEQVSGNAASPENHCFDPFYGVGVSDRKALSAPAHFSAEPSTVSATSKSHQLSLLFPDIEPSIIDTVLETVGVSINTAAKWLSSNSKTDSIKANSPSYDVQGKGNLGTPIAIKFEYHANDESENDSTKTGSLNQALSDIEGRYFPGSGSTPGSPHQLEMMTSTL